MEVSSHTNQTAISTAGKVFEVQNVGPDPKHTRALFF